MNNKQHTLVCALVSNVIQSYLKSILIGSHYNVFLFFFQVVSLSNREEKQNKQKKTSGPRVVVVYTHTHS